MTIGQYLFMLFTILNRYACIKYAIDGLMVGLGVFF